MTRIILTAVIGCLIAAPAGLAMDIQPPPWRGEYSTTSQVWEFSTLQPNPIPPDGPAPGGMPPLPSTQVTVTPGPPPWDQWLASDEPYQIPGGPVVGEGVWPLSGTIDVIVDNHEPPNDVKLVWVQITWRPQDPGEVPILENLNPSPATPPQLVAEEPLGPMWRESTYQWEIRPNPPQEAFTISGTINVDELVIDTWCIPEPTCAALFGLGSLILLRRRP